MKKTALVFLLFIFSGAAYAASEEIQDNALSIFSFFDIGYGARAIALAGAFTASADDSTAVYWNPAGLAKVKEMQASLEYKKWFVDSSVQNITGSMPLGPGTIGADIVFASLGFFQEKDSGGYLTGVEYNPVAFSLGASYGAQIMKGVYAGAGLRAGVETSVDAAYFGMSFDAGVIYEPFDFLSAALVVQNVKVISEYTMPVVLRGGVSFLPVKSGDHSLRAEADINYALNAGVSYAAGLEYSGFGIFSLRAGYLAEENLNNGGSLRAGAGFKAGMFNIDYAAVFFGDMGVNHIVTMGLKYSPDIKAAVEKMSTSDFERVLLKRYFSDAMIYYNLGVYIEALEQLKRANSVSPGNSTVKKWYGHILKKIKEGEKALTAEREPLEKAAALYKDNRYSEAMKILSSVPQANPYYKQSRQIMAEINKRTAEADIIADEAQAYMAKGDVLSAVRKINEAYSVCPGCASVDTARKKAAPLAAKKAQVHYLKGVDHYTSNRLEDAIFEWERAVELAKNSEAGKKSAQNILRAREKIKAIDRLKK